MTSARDTALAILGDRVKALDDAGIALVWSSDVGALAAAAGIRPELPLPASRPSPDKIIEASARYFGIRVPDVLGTRKLRTIVEARMVATYLLRTIYRYSLPELGRVFGKADHSSAMHAIRRVEARLARGDSELAKAISRVETVAGVKAGDGASGT